MIKMNTKNLWVFFFALASILLVANNFVSADESDNVSPDGLVLIDSVKIDDVFAVQNEVSDELTLDIKIWNGDFRTENDRISLNVQRPSYNAAIMSIDTAQSVKAGKVLPVDVVLKNTGYNNLDDVYVTVKIDALGLERTSYFGDLIALENKYDEDTTTKRFLIEI